MKKIFIFLMVILVNITYGQVGIGTDTPDPSAMLDITSTNQGVLVPRVNLTSTTLQLGVAQNATGLLVYNIGTAIPKGLYYWDGTSWKVFASRISDPASANLVCRSAVADPTFQVTGGVAIQAGTLLKIPYSLGNGGGYNGVTLVSTSNPNVTATIASGNLEQGSGTLNFSLSGTPISAQQAPTGITFNLAPFLTANPGISGCSSVTIGAEVSADIAQTAVMGYLALGTDPTGAQVYSLQATTPDGKFSFRISFPGTGYTMAAGSQALNVQLRNNQTTSIPIIWNYNTIYSGGTVAGANTLTVPPNVWGGNNSDSGSTWYSVTNTASIATTYWGNIGIYDGSGPEYRRYTWIGQNAGDKVAYTAYAMAALSGTSPYTPDRLKCYIKIEQVTAP